MNYPVSGFLALAPAMAPALCKHGLSEAPSQGELALSPLESSGRSLCAAKASGLWRRGYRLAKPANLWLEQSLIDELH